MANLSRIARPYALAAFQKAKEGEQLSQWKNFLNAAALIAGQRDVISLIENPQILSNKLFEFFQDVLSAQFSLNKEQSNFLLLLSDNQRLVALPQIAMQFNAYCAAYEKMSHVRMITAIETDKIFQQKLVQALSKRIQREITLQCEIDPTLIGGAIIHIGDRVIDGSVRGKLNRLLQSLLS